MKQRYSDSECYLDVANKWIKQWALCHYGDNCFCRKYVALYELMWMKVVINSSNSVPPLENRTPFLFTMCSRYFWMKTRTNNTSVSVSALSQGIISTSFRVFPRILIFFVSKLIKIQNFLNKRKCLLQGFTLDSSHSSIKITMCSMKMMFPP